MAVHNSRGSRRDRPLVSVSRLAPADELNGIAWFNALAPSQRLFWLTAAGPDASPADAWKLHKRGIQLELPLTHGDQRPFCQLCQDDSRCADCMWEAS
jgi:hypothetical protein